jgi:hypothetical protein
MSNLIYFSSSPKDETKQKVPEKQTEEVKKMSPSRSSVSRSRSPSPAQAEAEKASDKKPDVPEPEQEYV